MTTVVPAMRTLRPAVVTASRTAARGSLPDDSEGADESQCCRVLDLVAQVSAQQRFVVQPLH